MLVHKVARKPTACRKSLRSCSLGSTFLALSSTRNSTKRALPKNSLVVDNVRHTVVRLEHRDYKSYANYFITPMRLGLEYCRASATNVGRFLRSDFHDDSGVKNLVEAFYRSLLGEAPLPISYDEILRTSRIMDDIFLQLGGALGRESCSAEEPDGEVRC